MATAYDTWKTTPPCTSSPWDDADLALVAIKRTHNEAEVLDAVALFLCSDRSAEHVADLTKRLEAIGESAMDDYLNVIREAA